MAINITPATTVNPIETILDRLDLVYESNYGRWRAKCPAHQSDKSRKRTLSVGTADSGAVLLHCFAGCSVESIVGAVGLELKDLYPVDEYIKSYRSGNHRPRIDYRAIMDNAKGAAILVEVCMFALANGEEISPEDRVVCRSAASHLQEMIDV